MELEHAIILLIVYYNLPLVVCNTMMPDLGWPFYYLRELVSRLINHLGGTVNHGGGALCHQIVSLLDNSLCNKPVHC